MNNFSDEYKQECVERMLSALERIAKALEDIADPGVIGDPNDQLIIDGS